ncbi:MAG: hypothetical protein IJU40_02170, partial [Desulfovibrionaceae bacterium]|nr:hypothetical protein [Desulfovibrionaceae bacterium]
MERDLSEGKITIYPKNGIKYAYLQGKSIRNTDGKGPRKEFQIYLGRPIDLNSLVFYSKKIGLFIFDPLRGLKITPEDIPNARHISSYKAAVELWKNKNMNKQDKMDKTFIDQLANLVHQGNIYTLGFGSTFLLKSLITKIEYYPAVLSKLPHISYDQIMALLIFKLSQEEPYYNAEYWYSNDVASRFLPQANLSSEQIDKVLNDLGTPTISQDFLQNHLNFIYN